VKVGEESEENKLFNEIFKLFNLNWVKINSEETEQWKKEALKSLLFTKEKIIKIDKLIWKIVKIFTDKFSSKYWYVKSIRILQGVLNKKKWDSLKKDALIDYINYSFEEYIEEYENKQFRWNVDNPFNKYYSAHLKVLWRQAEIDIEIKLLIKIWTSRKYMDEKFGWIFSKKWLEFLKNNQVITQEEYNKYIKYSPNVDWLLKSLEEEWSIYSIAKQYFPDKVWAQDWFKQAIKDYLSEMIEVLDPRDIPDLLVGITTQLKKVVTGDYNISDAKKKAWELYNLYENIDEIVVWLDPYKKSLYKNYVGTSLSLAIVPFKWWVAKKIAVWWEKSETMKKIVTLLKIYQFKWIKTTDKLLEKAKEVQMWKIWKWWNAILINGNKEVSESIKKNFKNDWWIEKKANDGKWGIIYTLEKWKEKVTFRNTDSSWKNWSYPGYIHEQTIDVVKYDSENARIHNNWGVSKEIKFILSN